MSPNKQFLAVASTVHRDEYLRDNWNFTPSFRE